MRDFKHMPGGVLVTLFGLVGEFGEFLVPLISPGKTKWARRIYVISGTSACGSLACWLIGKLYPVAEPICEIIGVFGVIISLILFCVVNPILRILEV